jgi:hypothetical protein
MISATWATVQACKERTLIRPRQIYLALVHKEITDRKGRKINILFLVRIFEAKNVGKFHTKMNGP